MTLEVLETIIPHVTIVVCNNMSNQNTQRNEETQEN